MRAAAGLDGGHLLGLSQIGDVEDANAAKSLGADGRLRLVPDGISLGLVEPQRLLDRRHCSFSGILELLGSIHGCRLATLLTMGATSGPAAPGRLWPG